MYSEDDLIRKFESIERLFIGAKSDGERDAASNALERIRQRLAEIEKEDPPVEYQFSMNNRWSRQLFSALLRRYDIAPYRYRRQRYTTVMAKISKCFLDEVLWPEYEKLNKTLTDHIDEITTNIISKAINKDTSEASVQDEKKLLN